MAPSTLRDICFDCDDQHRVARFWSEVLGYTIRPSQSDEPVCLVPPEDGLRIWFNQVPEAKTAKNRVHIDINMPNANEMQRLLDLGATVLQEIRGEEGTLYWTIMADPEGNEFCAFPPKGS